MCTEKGKEEKIGEDKKKEIRKRQYKKGKSREQEIKYITEESHGTNPQMP